MVLSKQEFGRHVRIKRIAMGLSLRGLCREISKSPTYISKIENGDFDPPSPETVIRIALALNHDVDTLLKFAGKPHPDMLKKITDFPKESREALKNLK